MLKYLMLPIKLCYCGSMAEQLIRNEQVVSSILTSSSKKALAYAGAFFVCPFVYCGAVHK